ncbi:MAG: Obg family GTPase CgtA [Chloroflexi bacterium]|nr:Obg family GTPase CgtA [Chloroflexota bacterium]
MIDFLEIKVRAGNGGDGVVSFRREKYVPFGGPDGGFGGKGGAVVIEAGDGVYDLGHLVGVAEFRAEAGAKGGGGNRRGGDGESFVIRVPSGTEVEATARGDLGKADLLAEGSSITVAWGGEGGLGNKAFATSSMKVPRMAEAGTQGERVEVKLDYKVVADIALLGPANAGKSRLLNAICGARAPVADYPLTTLEPILGITEHEWVQYAIVEVPALWMVRLAKGEPLARSPLKHAERVRVIAVLLDTASDNLVEDYQTVIDGLERYGNGLAERPRMVLVNKIDLLETSSEAYRKATEFRPGGVETYLVSAAQGLGMEDAVAAMVRLAKAQPYERSQQVDSEVAILRPTARRVRNRVRVDRDEGDFVVRSERVERMVAGTDLNDWEARTQLMAYMERMGVHKALEKAGVKIGDTVRIGNTEMEWS